MAAREHPAAAVKRQQAEDVSVLLPSINHLSERQRQLFFLFHAQIARHRPEGFNRLVDDDVAQAAASVAATLETAGRGVIYEHTPSSLPAQRLARDLSGLLAETRERGARIYDGEAAIALRAIEHGARDAHKAAAPENAYLTLVARLLHLRGPASGEDREQERPPLIIP